LFNSFNKQTQIKIKIMQKIEKVMNEDDFKEKYYEEFNLTDETPGFHLTNDLETDLENVKKLLEFSKKGGVLRLPVNTPDEIRNHIKSEGYVIKSKIDDDVLKDVLEVNQVKYVVIETEFDKNLKIVK